MGIKYQMSPEQIFETTNPGLNFAINDASASADLLLVIFQRGGMDGLNAVIPYGDPDYYKARQKLAISAPSAGRAGADRRCTGARELLTERTPASGGAATPRWGALNRDPGQ